MKLIYENNEGFQRVTLSEVSNLFPNVSFPAVYNESALSQFGIYPLENNTSLPDYDPDTQKIVEVDPLKIENGETVRWVQQWDVAPLTDREFEVRTKDQKRLAVLGDSDVNELIIESSIENIDDYIDTRITTLDDAKEVLKVLTKTISILIDG